MFLKTELRVLAHVTGNSHHVKGSVGSEFTNVSARNLPTCRSIGSEFTKLPQNWLGIYQSANPWSLEEEF